MELHAFGENITHSTPLSLQCRPERPATLRRFRMSISLYELSIPVLIRGLTNLSAILDKAAAHAAAKKFDSVVLAQAHLFPGMHPLVHQVQIAYDTAKSAAGRPAHVVVPNHDDTEATLADLTSR